ncbi:hypothetical protein Cylst_5558 [Cylindrospermum stagnale PCC 7417]|uniref:Uncharacterized protein n=1 Tax=Cylindrospermum stagnale PCC 7417 TaxID=56107 RepID=K9X7G0_9NOST|nr:SUMF1/EgtB/PvdO family nonheme iron enzyme [Cylindrospermum stagnale]AFZ27567.1 hypothetical protein Cylst_5558 [Cylindrospermum stagnale PCC 7417]
MANWAIAIGINKYSNLKPLEYAKGDAEGMGDWFSKEGRFDEVFLFTEDSPPIPATPASIETQPTFGHLRRFLRAQFDEPLLQPGDNLWFFFAGHGQRHADCDYLMLSDSDPGDPEHTAISVDFVTQRLRRCGADNVVLFLDACRNEGSRSGVGIGGEHQGVITFYSCSSQQKSWEIEQLQHGSFTYALLEGLRINGEGNCATVERLQEYLKWRVPAINQQHGKIQQNPYAVAEPATKLHLILLPQHATLTDILQLKNDAFQAESQGNWELAKQLWMRVNVAARGSDWQVIEAFSRISQRQGISSSFPQPEPVKSPVGGRSVQPETPPTQENKLQIFQFEVVTVNAEGREVKRENCQAKYFTEYLGNNVTLDMISIPGGNFLMGSPENEEGYHVSQSPQHRVTIQPFFMGKYPVTQAQWERVAALPKVKIDLDSNPSNFKGANRPVEQVSWHDAQEFCARLKKHTGKIYRLPSEAEWEYACRAGTATPFYFGDTITTNLANYNGNYTYKSSAKGVYREETTDLGIFPANAFGLYDMHGNIWEWCQGGWHENYINSPTDGSAWQGENDNRRLLRGGSWDFNPRVCRSAARGRNAPDNRYYNFGFRVVCFSPARIL